MNSVASHDFRESSLNITPSVYLLSRPDAMSLRYRDELGRERYKKITEGDLHVRLRPSYITASAINHLDDLSELLAENAHQYNSSPKALLICSDQGPDESPSSIKFLYAIGHLFVKFGLALLVHVYHAPGQSAYNPVERYMSLLDGMDGVYLPEVLPGESTTPSKQTDLTEEQTFKWNFEIFKLCCDGVEASYRASSSGKAVKSVKTMWNPVPCLLKLI